MMLEKPSRLPRARTRIVFLIHYILNDRVKIFAAGADVVIVIKTQHFTCARVVIVDNYSYTRYDRIKIILPAVRA